MAKKLIDILSAAAVVRDETNEKANTAERVGGVLVELANYLSAFAPVSNVTVEADGANVRLVLHIKNEDGTVSTRGVTLPAASTNNAGVLTTELLKALNAADRYETTSRQAADAELIKRIIGKSASSSAYTDPFKYLDNFASEKDENGTVTKHAIRVMQDYLLDTLRHSDFNDSFPFIGHMRAHVEGVPIEMWTYVKAWNTGSTNGVFVQVVRTNFGLKNGVISSALTDSFHEYFRTVTVAMANGSVTDVTATPWKESTVTEGLYNTINEQKNKLSDLESEVIYDVSAHNNGAVFDSLSALLSASNLSTLIPTSVRYGGMSIRFVQGSDNKYVQYRYMGTATTGTPNPFLDTDNWTSGDGEFITGEKVSEVGIDDVPTAESNNLVKSSGVASELSKMTDSMVELSGDVVNHGEKLSELLEKLTKNVIGDCVELKGRLLANGAYEQRPDLAMSTYVIRVNYGDTIGISGEASYTAAYNFYNEFDGTTLSAINLIGTAQPIQQKGSAPFDLTITAPEECYLALCSKNTYENIALKVPTNPNGEIDKLREYTEFNIGKLIHKVSLGYSSIDEDLILKNGFYTLISGKITFVSDNNYVSSQCFDVSRISKIYVRTYLSKDYYGIVAFDNEMNIIDSLCQNGMNNYRWYEYDIPANVSYIAISGSSSQRDTMCLSTNKKTYCEQSINIGVNNDYSDIDFVHGNIDGQGNIYSTGTEAFVTKFPIKTSPSIKRIVIDRTFESSVYLYDNELNLVSSKILSSNGIFTDFDNAEYFAVRVNPKMSIPLSRENFNIEYDILSWIEQYKPVNIDDKPLLAGIAISHYTTELMAHCSTIVNGNDGFFYIPYYASDTTSVETFSADIQCRLAKVSQYNFNNCEIINVLRKGEVVGDYTQSNMDAPYDPNAFIVGDVLRYIMVISDARGVALGYRDINKNTLALADSIGLCKIKYGTYEVEMTNANLGVMLDRHFGTTEGRIGTYPILTNTIVKSGEWSYCILSGLGATNNFTGCIVKTQDGITWEVVAWCNDVYTSANGDPMWEAAIAIKNNKVFVYFKGNDAPIAYYNMDTNSWSNLVYLMGYKGGGYNAIDSSRPSLVVIQNRVFAVQNVLPRYNGKFRSQVDFCHIDEDLSVVSRKTMYAPNGCHYMSFANIGDFNYMCYTEDKSGRNNLNKGNISIMRIDL